MIPSMLGNLLKLLYLICVTDLYDFHSGLPSLSDFKSQVSSVLL